MFYIDFNGDAKHLDHYWSNCVGAGRANEGLRADWQTQLKTAVSECGFRYLRFHGLLHDDMHVCTRINGELNYNFQYVDKLFDYMLSVGIRPFVEFGFMPEALTSGTAEQFWWKGKVSPPDSFEEWADLIDHIVRHWISRYGMDEVVNWYFEVWNEPNLKPFWNGSKSQYFELYRTTVNTIKAISPLLRTGGPATSNYVPDTRFDGEWEDTSVHATFKAEDINSLTWRGVWIEDFLTFCEKEKLPVDFVSTHPYPTDFALDGHGECSGLTRYKDSLHDDIMWLKEIISKSAYADAELHLTEWSTSPTSRDYSHDYLPAAAYVIRSCLNNSGEVDSLSYWVFTDVFEEVGAGPKEFHGGFGMMTLQGVKKPVFHAYRMLNGLGSEEIGRGDGWIMTRKGERLSGVFYNYPEDYYSTVPMSVYPDQSIAAQCQETGSCRDIDVLITGLEPGDRYSFRMLRKEHTAIGLWNEMGSPTEPLPAQEKLLRQKGEEMDIKELVVDQNGNLHLDFTMEAWSIGEII